MGRNQGLGLGSNGKATPATKGPPAECLKSAKKFEKYEKFEKFEILRPDLGASSNFSTPNTNGAPENGPFWRPLALAFSRILAP